MYLLSIYRYSTFGSRDYYFWLDNVMCLGTESRLADCPSNGWGQHNCGRYELAGVQCLPPGNNKHTISIKLNPVYNDHTRDWTKSVVIHRL